MSDTGDGQKEGGCIIATRCPFVKDPAPEFMTDVPLTKAGDKWPDDAFCEAFDVNGHQACRVDPQSCTGRLTVVCAFDPECCICLRFALPRLEELFKKHTKDPLCAIVAVGRGCDKDRLASFREECAQAAKKGDRYIVQLSMPMAPDSDSKVFQSLAEVIVPRFYLLGPDGSILLQQAGYHEDEFANLEHCLNQELLYL